MIIVYDTVINSAAAVSERPIVFPSVTRSHKIFPLTLALVNLMHCFLCCVCRFAAPALQQRCVGERCVSCFTHLFWGLGRFTTRVRARTTTKTLGWAKWEQSKGQWTCGLFQPGQGQLLSTQSNQNCNFESDSLSIVSFAWHCKFWEVFPFVHLTTIRNSRNGPLMFGQQSGFITFGVGVCPSSN